MTRQEKIKLHKQLCVQAISVELSLDTLWAEAAEVCREERKALMERIAMRERESEELALQIENLGRELFPKDYGV